MNIKYSDDEGSDNSEESPIPTDNKFKNDACKFTFKEEAKVKSQSSFNPNKKSHPKHSDSNLPNYL